MLLLSAAVISGCASHRGPAGTESPDVPEPITPTVLRASTGERIADVALSMVGTPYRFGGTTPQGFDCSGLVYFSYKTLGLAVPRTSRAQRQTAKPVDRRNLRHGDLLFFDTSWKFGHVGIYVGDGRFVHAPSSGKSVTVERLDEGYYANRLEHAGRLH